MSVANGQDANQTTFNAAFLSKTAETGNDTIGIIGLKNTSDPDSGNEIDNTQRYINEIADSDGTVGEGDATRKAYSSNLVVADGDSRKVAIQKLDAHFGAIIESITMDGGTPVIGVVNFVSGIGIDLEQAGQDITINSIDWPVTAPVDPALIDNQATPTLIFGSRIDLVQQVIIDFTMKRGSTTRAGYIRIINDGSANAAITWDWDEPFGDCGIAFTTDIQSLGGHDCMTLLYTSTSTGTMPLMSMKLKTKYHPT